MYCTLGTVQGTIKKMTRTGVVLSGYLVDEFVDDVPEPGVGKLERHGLVRSYEAC